MTLDKSKVTELIARTLGVDPAIVTEELAIGDIPEWDSLAHVRIIAALETELGVQLDIEQTIDMEDVDDILSVVLEPLDS